jgi:hypothetical protein
LAPEPTNGVELLQAAVELLARDARTGTVEVRGSSMLPSLRPGQRLAVEFACGEPRRGDLLLFRQADYLAVHRLLGPARPTTEGERRLRTRGDGQLGLDPPLDPARVLGRVTAVGDDGAWWSLDGFRARVYARCLARHDLFWAGLGVLARTMDRGLGRSRADGPLSFLTGRLDRGLLGVAHALMFRICHLRIPPPEVSTAD